MDIFTLSAACCLLMCLLSAEWFHCVVYIESTQLSTSYNIEGPMSFMGNERSGGGMGGRFGGRGGGRFDGRGDGRFDGGRGNFRDRMDNMGPPMNFDHGFNDPGYFQGPVRGPVPCTFFASAQGCRFGDSCKNIHDSTGNLR